jgi:hypothetical protein
VDNKILAGQLAVKMNRSLVLVKIGYDESYSGFAPGNYLLYKIVEDAFAERKYDEINCITNAPWNHDWGMKTKNYYDFYIYRKAIRPYIAGYLPKKIRLSAGTMPGVKSTVTTVKNFLIAAKIINSIDLPT